MNTNIFREYDIRGIYPTDINEEFAHKFGLAFASYIEDKTVVIGHDNRLSSQSLNSSVINGLYEGGAHVIDLGLCTTPMYYLLKKYLCSQNGIMITASHNPKEYNGFKISFDYDGNAYGDAIYKFRDFLMEGNFTKAQGSYEKYDKTHEVYLELIKNTLHFKNKKLKVAFDPGNGTGCVILKEVLDLFDFDYEIINDVSDGNFPNHHPDPCEPKNMVQLAKYVKENGFDLGIGIDGDADRVGAVDDEGNYIPADKLMIIFYKSLADKLKNKKAIMDVKCSCALIEEMNKLGISTLVYRTGNSYMNHKINLDKFDFGGEFSGHVWFTDNWPGFDDGIYAGLRLIQILRESSLKLSDMVKEIPVYYNTPEIKVEVKEEQKDLIINKVKQYLDQNDIKYNAIDGVRVDFDDGFFLIRKSNTGPNLTLRFEKKTMEDLEKLQNHYMSILQSIIDSLNE